MQKHIPVSAPDSLTDIGGLTLDAAVPHELRAALVLKAVKDPYRFRVGDIGVELEFADGAPPLHEVFTALLVRKKSGL